MTTKITSILFNLTMKSSVMNFHDFAGCNLIFTMITGKHPSFINDVHRLVCWDIIATKVIFTFMSGISLVGMVENRKSWKITKPQVDPIDAHKN